MEPKIEVRDRKGNVCKLVPTPAWEALVAAVKATGDAAAIAAVETAEKEAAAASVY